MRLLAPRKAAQTWHSPASTVASYGAKWGQRTSTVLIHFDNSSESFFASERKRVVPRSAYIMWFVHTTPCRAFSHSLAHTPEHCEAQRMLLDARHNISIYEILEFMYTISSIFQTLYEMNNSSGIRALFCQAPWCAIAAAFGAPVEPTKARWRDIVLP